MNKDINVPDVGIHIWNWFWQLSNVRAGAQVPISFSEIQNWSAVMRTDITPNECSIITAMDTAFRRTLQEEIASNTARAQLRQKQGIK